TPATEEGVVEGLPVAVAAARVDQQDGPAPGHELLVVEVHLVGGGVPGVVRSTVEGDEKRARAGGLGRAHQPGLDHRAVADAELPGLTPEELDLGERLAVRGERRGRAGREVDLDDLPERVRRTERDGRRVT